VAGLRIPDNFLYYLSLHEDCNERLLVGAGDLTPEDVEVCIHPEVARIKKMVYAVLGEAHRMKAFVRLQPLGARVLYGFLRPRHRIGEHICDTLARRNAGIIVVLGNGSESWIALCREGRIWRDHSGGMAIAMEKLKDSLHSLHGSEEEADLQNQDIEGLWQVYYDSQYCPERKNKTAFHRHMPRRDQDSAGLRLVQNKKNASLEDFLCD
jgi:probable DNA metabolism protein